ncbi:MAG: ABC transporter substrate-binding protein [Mycobacteriales bacterium]
MIKAGFVTTFQNFNPFDYNSISFDAANAIARLVLPQPMTVSPTFAYKYNPALLTGAPLVKRAGGKMTVTYAIRPDAAWSDGSPITVADFQYVLRAAKRLHYFMDNLDIITEVHAVGDNKKKVAVEYSRVTSEWMASFPFLLPSGVLKRAGRGYKAQVATLERTVPAAGGPLRMTAFDKTAKRVSLVLNPRYLGKKSRISGLDITLFNDAYQAQAAASAGEVDVVEDAAPSDTEIHAFAAAHSDGVRIGSRLSMVLFNASDPMLKDSRVRVALATALDRRALLMVYTAGGPQHMAPGSLLMPAEAAGYEPADAAYASPNVAKAALLLQQAGYKKGTAGIFAKGGKPLMLKFSVSKLAPAGMHDAQVVQQNLGQLGVKVTIDPFGSEDFDNRLQHFQMIALNYQLLPDFATESGVNFQCKNRYNYSKFCSNAYDAALGKAFSASDDARRIAAINRADALLWKGMAALPVARRAVVAWVSPQLHGTAYNPANSSVLGDISGWRTS